MTNRDEYTLGWQYRSSPVLGSLVALGNAGLSCADDLFHTGIPDKINLLILKSSVLHYFRGAQRVADGRLLRRSRTS